MAKRITESISQKALFMIMALQSTEYPIVEATNPKPEKECTETNEHRINRVERHMI